MTSRPAPAGGPDDEGQILLLVLCYMAIALMLVLVVVSASAVHLDRKRLLALADGAALAAADDLDLATYYRVGARPGEGVPLSDAGVRESVRAYLNQVADPPAQLIVDPATGTDPTGRTAQVRLCARTAPPFTGWVLAAWSGGVRICADARARSDLRTG